MISFIASLIALILGYVIYGKYVEKVFGVSEERETPAVRLADGVDYVELDWKKAFLIQFLNIAGLGPIFGAVAGALWGPAAFLWIVFGCIFAGATHDYLSGMLSVRHDGATIAEIVGHYLGDNAKKIMRVFSVVLLVLVGVVFVNGPAGILASMTSINTLTWVAIIVAYYMLATVLPVDKLIGKIYPIFGASLIIMGIGIGGGLILKGYNIPEISMVNLHPKGTSIYPYLFITIACGAISGFHATQSPLMARCMKNEKEGRRIFYGSMIAEGVIALVWAAAAMTFFGGTEGLMNAGPAGVVVNTISNSILGKVGGALALLGVVACPITSGDTAFRSARLAIADAINYKQGPVKNRFIIAIPLFAVGIGLCFIDFAIIWRYFAWANQTLATIALWAGAVYLANEGKNHWIATIPGVFMTAVVTTYILIAPEGFRLSETIGYVVGIAGAVVALVLFLKKINNKETIKA
ncbi:carbon starvation protein A [Cetobacterium somerae]|uniref:carbon starvation CstA family protein n=1 Tax=Cetobacterium sp. NK01 TaxID=2993530 RepID=UPI0021166DDA|nr:carbon starvation protein A [Cetobacterium sp. NK01]MCQ8211444.1 carbon starvation protein A [Cetobacterium sp. NK01]